MVPTGQFAAAAAFSTALALAAKAVPAELSEKYLRNENSRYCLYTKWGLAACSTGTGWEAELCCFSGNSKSLDPLRYLCLF